MKFRSIFDNSKIDLKLVKSKNYNKITKHAKKALRTTKQKSHNFKNKKIYILEKAKLLQREGF